MKRRDLLKSSFLLGPAYLGFNSLVPTLVSGLINQAIASENEMDLVNYVCLWMNDGVERWYFDGNILPFGQDGTETRTRYNKIKDYYEDDNKHFIKSLEYATTSTKINGKIYLPYLWESLLPGISGNVQMKELADHMISIRGIDTGVGFDAHGANVSFAENPMKRIPTISALPSQNSPYTFPFMYSGGAIPSLGDIQGANFSPDNLTDVLDRFRFPSEINGNLINTQRVVMKSSELRDIANRALNSLRLSLPKHKQAFAQKLLDSRKAAVQMMDFITDNLGSMQEDYEEAFQVYSTLFTSCVNNRLEGRGLESLDKNNIFNPKTLISSSVDKSSLIEQFNVGGSSFKDGIWTSYLEYVEEFKFKKLAQSFASIEVLFKYNVTNSIKLTCNNQEGSIPSPGDMHFEASNTRLFSHSKHYQVLATGLLACLDRMRSIKDTHGKTIFDKTVFHLRSEFDRSPVSSGLGSNHNIRNCTETFFSGMIENGPHLIGNINGANQQLDGAPLKFANNTVLSYKNIWSTVSTISGGEEDRNFKSLIKRNGLKLVPATDECKNIL